MEIFVGLVVRYVLSISNSGKITSARAIIVSLNEDDTANLQLDNEGGNIVIATSVGIDWIIPEYDS